MTLPAPFLLGEAPDRCSFFIFIICCHSRFKFITAAGTTTTTCALEGLQIQLLGIVLFERMPVERASLRWERCGNADVFAVTTASLQNSSNIKLANLLESFGKEGKRN